MQEMVIHGIGPDPVSGQPLVLLKTAGGNTFLPIWIGQTEANAILAKLHEVTLPRPMTHDLLASVFTELDAPVARIAITEIRDGTFYATLTVIKDGNEIEIDCRPSDALAIAVRAEVPIYAADDVLSQSGVEFEEVEESQQEKNEIDSEVAEFRKLLDDAKPEDFES